MKKKILYIALAIIFISALIVTAVVGLKVDLYYTDGYTVTFTVGKKVTEDEIKNIAKEVFGDKKILVQRVELFQDSSLIKTKEEITQEQIQTLCDKLNEKYEVELSTTDNFTVSYSSNVRLRNVIEPYIIPLGLSTLLIVGYYAIRYKGTKKMLGLLKYLLIVEGLLYSIYAICRVPVNELTMPIALFTYGAVVSIYTAICELSIDTKKGKKEKNKPE